MHNNIKKIIDEKGLKTSFVIEKTGISKSAFYLIMNCESIPSLVNARKISTVLEVSLEDVFPNEKFERSC